MWPFRRSSRDDDHGIDIEINEFLHDESAERLAVALEARDWPATRDILTAAGPEHLMFLMEHVASTDGVQEWIPDVIRAEPDATLPLLIRGARAVHWAWDARGGGTADTVGRDQWKVWFQRLKLAENCLDEVIERDPGCAEAWHYLIILGRARQLSAEERWYRFNRLIEIDPTHLFGHEQMLNALMAKWSGSTEAMFDFARTRAAAHPGTHLPLLVAKAHLEQRRVQGGEGYLSRGEVAGEIYAAAKNSVWHDDYRPSLLTPVLWNQFAYTLTLGRFHREACDLYDKIGDDWVRTSPWYSTERYTELRALARDLADDPGPDPTGVW